MDKNFDMEGNVNFLSSILEKTNSQIEHIDNQINIMTGIGLAIFVFTTSQFGSENHWVYQILSIFSALSVITSLFAIHPPKFMRKQGQSESVFYARAISEHSTAAKYDEKLGQIIGELEKIRGQYASEIFNMCTYYYRPKRKLFRWARNFLLIGVILATLVYVFALI